MAERPHELGDCKGMGDFEVSFRELMFCITVYGQLARGIVILQLFCWKVSHKETCSRLHSFEIEFYFLKTKKITF